MEYYTLDNATTLDAARQDPVGFVRRIDRAVIDEIQRAPELLLAIKESVDIDQRPVVAQMQAQEAPRLDLNKADALTLQKELNGIGKAKAEAIVAYREANGPFASVDELLEIKGIGNALLERNRDKVMVE